jgi:glycosyltransferase A (GT-A) superfamily protein (DUF2064 family)
MARHDAYAPRFLGGAVTTADVTVLVVAKAPVAGLAKTRMVPPLSATEAAELAAAALLDTFAAVRDAQVRHAVVALTGDVRAGELAGDVERALTDFEVIGQRGDSFADRLCNAHTDVADRFGVPVLQIGTDTPQITPDLLQRCAIALTEPEVDAVLGPAVDGGWWALGLRRAGPAQGLREVAMSTPWTGADTLAMLRNRGQRTRILPELADVDYPVDALRVAGIAGGRFALTVDALSARLCAGLR